MPPVERIHSYVECRRCAGEASAHRQSPRKYSRFRIGLTRDGIQVWCSRHEMEVAHFTPEQLGEFMSKGPQCECCPGGMHRS